MQTDWKEMGYKLLLPNRKLKLLEKLPPFQGSINRKTENAGKDKLHIKAKTSKKGNPVIIWISQYQ